MVDQRDTPYFWATWLARILAGDKSCEWAVWFKAHHQNWARQPSDFDQATWLATHTAALNEQKQLWQESGHAVFVENQNAFRLQGHTATLAGKPDLIVERDERHSLIVDVKTGQEQPWHYLQVMLYMYALPRAAERYRNVQLAGNIVYPRRTVRVPQDSVDQGFVHNLGSLITRLASAVPPPPVPSSQECRYCDITAEHCHQRIESDDTIDSRATDDF